MIVVYNDEAISQKENESEALEKTKEKLRTYAQIDKNAEILFNLERYKGTLYKDVITINKDEFMKKYALQCNLISTENQEVFGLI